MIIYIHLLFFLVAYFSQLAFQRLETRLNLLSSNCDEEPEVPSNAPGSTEGAETFGPGYDELVVDAPVRRQHVFELALTDAQPSEIAAETKMPRAEVDFLLKLSRMTKRKAGAASS